MEIPKQIRIRLLLTFDKKSFFKFYWFEMKNDDFYWGSAYKANHPEKTKTGFDGIDMKIEIPKDFNDLEKIRENIHTTKAVKFIIKLI